MVESGQTFPSEVTSADDLGAHHSKQLAEELGAEYRHIPTTEMTNEFHNARAICFDGTGRFNPAVISSMPEHFMSSCPGFGLSDEYSVAELSTLAGIALGDHGYGSRFDKDNPLYIIVSTNDQEQLNHLIDLAKNAVEQYGDRVQIIGFI